VRGIKESARTNNIMVLLKIIAILVFVTFHPSSYIPANYHPFAPNGWPGILTGGSIVFFTYIGFDSVSTAAENVNARSVTCRLASSAHLSSARCLIGRCVVLTGLVSGIPCWRRLPVRQHPQKTSFTESVGGPHRCNDGHDLFPAGFQLGQLSRMVCQSRDVYFPDFGRVIRVFDAGFFNLDGRLSSAFLQVWTSERWPISISARSRFWPGGGGGLILRTVNRIAIELSARREGQLPLF